MPCIYFLKKIVQNGENFYYLVDTMIFIGSNPSVLLLLISSKGNFLGIINIFIIDTKESEYRDNLIELEYS